MYFFSLSHLISDCFLKFLVTNIELNLSDVVISVDQTGHTPVCYMLPWKQSIWTCYDADRVPLSRTSPVHKETASTPDQMGPSNDPDS